MNGLVTVRDGEVRASSVDIAAAFDKAHRDVVRAIENLINNLEALDSSNVRNFAPIEFRDGRNRRQRAYEMDRDGFSLLAMGFTGAKALEWKLKFLEAFRRMEAALSQSLAANDNGLSALHALLRTPEGRDAIGRGMEMVRRMKELRGPDAALELWKKLGPPLPDNIDDYSMPALERSLEAKPPGGEMYQWIEERRVGPCATRATHWTRLWEDYFNWCHAAGLEPYTQAKFKWHLRNHFGAHEGKRFVFAVRVG